MSAKKNTITVTDNRTGKSVEIEVGEGNTVPAPRLGQLGIRLYDPAYMNTAVARSKICEVDGDNGILRYAGYPIEQLAEKSDHIEVAYLLAFGELPTKEALAEWRRGIMNNSAVPDGVLNVIKSFRPDAHPMGIFIAAMAALGTFNPEDNPALVNQDMFKGPSAKRIQVMQKIIGSVTTIGAAILRHRAGQPFVKPDPSLGYAENFLHMLWHPKPIDKRLARALEVLFILHADHEMNCSTATIRHVGSSLVDPYAAVAGATAALYGPLHGGANEAVVRMLDQIKEADKVAEFVDGVKNRKRKLMGFGHRIYKNYDPRAKLVQKTAYEVFDILGKEPLIEVAVGLEQAALSDDYFKQRKLYPNVDFYSGLIYRAMGFPTDFFPVLFAMPRTAGWLCHWAEGMDVEGAQIWRPRQVYVGYGRREFVDTEKRKELPKQGVKAKL